MAELSDRLLFVAVLVYALAMLAFAGAAATRSARRATVAAPARVLVGAGGPPVAAPPAGAPERTSGASRAGRVAVALTAVGWVVHVGSALTRGLAAGRAPWGNMYEFSSCVALVAVTAFLVLLARGRVDVTVGAFVMEIGRAHV